MVNNTIPFPKTKEFPQNKAPHFPKEPWKWTFLDLHPTWDLDERERSWNRKKMPKPSINPYISHYLWKITWCLFRKPSEECFPNSLSVSNLAILSCVKGPQTQNSFLIIPNNSIMPPHSITFKLIKYEKQETYIKNKKILKLLYSTLNLNK